MRHLRRPLIAVAIALFATPAIAAPADVDHAIPGARPGGMGEAFKQGTRPVHDLIAAAVTLAACALAGWHGLYALLTALAGSTALLLYARRRLGGVTGDVFGCTVECTEWLVLLTFCTL